VLFTLFACQGEPAPEVIFIGRFITLDAAVHEVEALAVTGGRIVAAGTAQSILELAGDHTQRVDIRGVAVPGWVDAHVHVAGLGDFLETLNVQAQSKEAILEKVARAAAATPRGEWIVGRGWDEGYFVVEEDPTAADLDPVSPDHPVILSGIGGHSVWVNSQALARAGIDAATANPEGGRIVRDAEGRATGLLLETAESLVTSVMPDTTSPEVLERRMLAALERYTHWGLTGVHDAGAGLAEIAVYKKLAEGGELPLRVYAMAHGDAAVEHYLSSGPETGLYDGRLTIRSFKIYVDGALGSRGAELSEPYSDAPDSSGLRQMQDDDLDAFMVAAKAKGFQVNAHVIGDLAVRRALDAIERNGLTKTDRFRLEHASMITPGDMSRFAGLGAIASMQPVFVGEYQRWGEDRVGSERAAWILPFWDLLSTGAVLASGTDFPASDSGDPRHTLYALVTRKGFDGQPADGWFPDQRIDTETALRSMSEGPAYAAFEELDLGTLGIGRYADFTVLADDPQNVPPEALRSLAVTMTVVGGKITFNAAE
jgi:predicted amidohydrolase YtcJ